MKQFTYKWNRRNHPQWAEHLAEFKGKPVRYLEVGVFEGYSLCWMMDNILTHPDSRAVGIDLWEGEIPGAEELSADAVYATAMFNVGDYGRRVELIRGQSHHMLVVGIQVHDRLKRDLYDIAFIDGSHVPLDAVVDLCLAWKLVKPGGIIILDDMKKQAGIRQAVMPLLPHLGQHEIVWDSNRQVGVRKLK
jgi:predicted O-methyltransferase YrrM